MPPLRDLGEVGRLAHHAGLEFHVAADVGLGGADDGDVPEVLQALLQACEFDELGRAALRVASFARGGSF